MEQVVLASCALAAHRVGGWGRGLAPTALKMPPLPGLRTAYLALTAVKRAGVAAISNVQQRTITEEQWLLSPGRGDIFNAIGRKPTATKPRSPRRRAVG